MIPPILKHRGLTFSAIATLACTLAAQTTTTVPCAADNSLYQSATGALSNGAGDSLFVGVTGMNSIRRTVLRFDVAAAVPANATIIAASMNLDCAQTSVALPMPLTAHRLLQAWGEGTSNATAGGGGSGAPSTAGDATWVHTFWPGTFWASAGGDFDPTPTVTISMPPFGSFSSPPTLEVTAAVQSWLDNPATNFGWLLKMDESLPATSHRLHSRQATLGPGPSLTVTYMLPGTGGSWGTGCPVGGGNFTNTFVGAPIGGTTVQIAKTSATPLSIGGDFFSLALDPVGAPLLPGCTIYLPLAQPLIPGGIFLTDGAGAGATLFPVPAGFPGYLIACQAVVLDPNPLGFVVSNAALAVLQ